MRMKENRTWPALIALILVSVSLSGCIILAPFIQAWKNVGATAEDRRALLGIQIKKFGDALYWGKGEAALYVDKDADDSVRSGLSIDREEIRVVETKVKHIDYADDTYTAEVEFLIRFYRIPYYIVTDSKEKQTWKFRLGDNWWLTNRIPGKELSSR